MKKIFTLIALAMLCSVGMSAQDATNLYLRGDINGWGALDDYCFTDNGDGTFTLEKTFELSGNFKIADKNWSNDNWGSNGENAIIGTFSVANGGGNISCNNAVLNVTKITFNKNEGTVTIDGASEANIFDVNKDYGITFHQYADDESSSTEMKFEGNGKYTVKVVLIEQKYGCKFASENYNPINLGYNEKNASVGIPYIPKNGSDGNIWFDDSAMPEWGATYNVTLIIDKDWNATVTFEKDNTATENTFTVNITGCDEGYAIFGGETYKNGDTFKSASETPNVNAGHIVGYKVSAPTIEDTDVNITYEEVGTVEVTVNVTNNTGDDLYLFACEGLTWENLNEGWPGEALVDNSAVVTMTKGDYLHMILNNGNGNGKQTANIGGVEGIQVSDNTTIAITVSNNTETEGNAYVFNIDNIATAIANVSAPAAQTMSIYSINGQRLQKAQRGLNIINGKKVVVM